MKGKYNSPLRDKVKPDIVKANAKKPRKSRECMSCFNARMNGKKPKCSGK